MVASQNGPNRGRSVERQDGSRQSRGHSQSRGQAKKCYYCEKESHLIRHCWKLKDDKESRKQSDSTAVVDSYEDDEDLPAVFPEKGMDNSTWVIDSGCSFHMRGDKKIFFFVSSM